jgi:uncharacterized protein (TIGR03435 family)
MKRTGKSTEDILSQTLGEFKKISPDEMASAGTQAWKYLASQQSEPQVTEKMPAEVVRPVRWRRWPAVAVIAAAIALAVLVPPRILQSAPAVLEDGQGKRDVQYGDVVRPRGDASAMLSMADGSRVEMRSDAELSLERGDNGGTRIHLNRGGVIVDAAAQQDGNLYVQTKDMMASVSGAVSLVKSEEQGSRVTAIGGEVRVQQGATEKMLRPGEQMTSNPRMESLSVKEEVSWSREALAHLAVLQQAAASPAPGDKLAFETVAIRLSAPAAPPAAGVRGGGAGANSRPTKDGCSFTSMGYTEQLDPGRFAVTRVTVFHLIALAYPVQHVPNLFTTGVCDLAGSLGFVSGGPDWIRTDMWDIQAGIPDGLFNSKPAPSDPKVQQMLQSLLTERVKLVIRRETKDVPVYLLKMAKDGPRFNGRRPARPNGPVIMGSDGVIRPANEVTPPDGSFRILGPMRDGTIQFGGTNVSTKDWADHLFGIGGRPVFDRTGLTGRFDFYFDYLRPGAGRDPSILTSGDRSLDREALKAMGFYLEESSAGFDVWVIERAEKPSEN